MKRTVLWCVLAAVAAAVLFAPVLGGGWCADAPLAEASYCETWTRSIVGVDTSIWLWLAATTVLVAGTWWWARPRRPRRPRRG